MKEAPSNEGAFLVSGTPHIGKAAWVGYLVGGYGDRQREREDIQGHRFTMAAALPGSFIRPSRGQQQNSNLELYEVRPG